MRPTRAAVLAVLPLLAAVAASAASTSFGTLAVADGDLARAVSQGLTMAAAGGSDLNAHAELRVLNHQLSTARRLVEQVRDMKSTLEDAPNGAYARYIETELDIQLRVLAQFTESLDETRDAQDASYHTCRRLPEAAQTDCLQPLARHIRRLSQANAPELDRMGTTVLNILSVGKEYDQARAAVAAFIADPFIASLAAARPAILLRKDDQPAYLWADVTSATGRPAWTITVSKVRRGNDPRLSQIPAAFAGYPVQVLDGVVRR
ncbi:MAG: hypothetical protein SF051_11220 [Elusimicrobiota bacterium]|nr:hypothetical protein [Elusimicrobiota bacterium]